MNIYDPDGTKIKDIILKKVDKNKYLIKGGPKKDEFLFFLEENDNDTVKKKIKYSE